MAADDAEHEDKLKLLHRATFFGHPAAVHEPPHGEIRLGAEQLERTEAAPPVLPVVAAVGVRDSAVLRRGEPARSVEARCVTVVLDADVETIGEAEAGLAELRGVMTALSHQRGYAA